MLNPRPLLQSTWYHDEIIVIICQVFDHSRTEVLGMRRRSQGYESDCAVMASRCLTLVAGGTAG